MDPDVTEMPDYRVPGPLTELGPAHRGLAEGLPDDPVGICAAVQQLVIQPHDAVAAGVPERRVAEKDIRSADSLVAALVAVDPAPLHVARTPETRVVGTCRHFATLSCALLRLRGIPARVRCGFGTYFVEDRGLDHWITEYRKAGEDRWVRIDPEHLGRPLAATTEDLRQGAFLTGGEAWSLYREGAVDPDHFGVPGTDHAWGWAEISGNAVRDLAALCKREMLPWDEWGRMTAAYQATTGADYDRLVDEIAVTCAADDPAAVARLYRHDDLVVPADMLV